MLVFFHILLYSSSTSVCVVVSDCFLTPPSMGFSRQESWGGLSCPPPGDLPDPGLETSSPVSPALVDGVFTTETPEKPHSPSTLLNYFPHILSFFAVSSLAPVILMMKIPPANAGDVRDVVPSRGWKDLLEEGMATHSSVLAWRIPWTEEPGRLQSMGSQRVRHD